MTQRKAKPDELRQLTEHFRVLGASQPQIWAKSQIEEGIPQYARLVFLRQAWKEVIADGDTAWIDNLIQVATQDPQAPGAGIGPALTRMLAAGVAREDIAEVVRIMQWELLFAITYLLSDPDKVEYPSEKLPRVNWALFEVDEEGIRCIPSLGSMRAF